MLKFITKKGLIVIVAIVAVATIAAATTVGVTTTTYQAQSGVQYIVTGGFTAVGDGFNVSTGSGTGIAPTSPVTWTSGGSAFTPTTAGDWVYSVTVTINTSPAPAAGTYTVSVEMSQNGGGLVTLPSLSFTITSTSTGSMTFYFNEGSSSFVAPTGIVVTVQ